MKTYNYFQAVKEDVLNYIKENEITITEENREDVEEQLKLYKDFMDVPEYCRHTAEELKNNWQDGYNFWKGRNDEKAESIKNAHLNAIEKGYNFRAFVPSEKKASFIFSASCGVVRTEKTKEFATKNRNVGKKVIFDAGLQGTSSRMALFSMKET